MFDVNFTGQVWGGSITCRVDSGALFLFQWPNYRWPRGFRLRWQHQLKIDILLSSRNGLWGKMKTTCHLKGNRDDRTSPRVTHVRMTGGKQDEDEVIIRHQQGQDRLRFVNRKRHSACFHQHKPSKQTDWQCETGPSIAPYWDHNIILPLFG